MKLKCNDGIIRRFRTSNVTGCIVSERESICMECGKPFGFHDTKVLKPEWKAHICSENKEKYQ